MVYKLSNFIWEIIFSTIFGAYLKSERISLPFLSTQQRYTYENQTLAVFFPRLKSLFQSLQNENTTKVWVEYRLIPFFSANALSRIEYREENFEFLI